MSTMTNLNLDPDEIEKFEKSAAQWWDEPGPSAPLHAMNPTRISFVKDQIDRHYPGIDVSDLGIVDVGCGGGLVCEPLARLGFQVTGVDAGETAINVAQKHASDMGLEIDYRNMSADLITDKFDVVLALEVIEHVPSVDDFLKTLSGLVKPGGLVILSTLNRTAKSFAVAILGAEYILRQLPIGTHDHAKFIKPRELEIFCESAGLLPILRKGLSFDLFSRSWHLSNTLDINYFLVAKPNLVE